MNKKIFRLFFVSIFVFAVIGTVSAWPSDMLEWEKTDHGSCHFGSYTVGTGALSATITPAGAKEPGQQITIVFDINGFTEAANKHVVIGISARLEDNNEFFLGVQEDQGSYFADHAEVGLDSSGDANNTVTLVLFAPTTDGNYTLSVIACEGGEGYGSWIPFNYLELLIEVEVLTPTGGSAAIPGFDLPILLSVGFITGAPLALIILRKRRKK
ncbi:MAG: hypothetical protein ACXACP_14085 [Candidatus Hodarchaeales archaeon]